MPRRILILGGTGEGSALARRLAGRPDVEVISSLAGRTDAPRVPMGSVRLGGFGGAQGLAAYLRDSGIERVIDATHPFAARMGHHAALACASAGIPLLRLERPAWEAGEGDDWRPVDDWSEAADALRSSARRVLLAVGRLELEPFSGLSQVWFLIRSVGAPSPMPEFAQAELLLARGPFTVEDETALLCRYRIDHLVCKNSGGDDAKLVAARRLGVPVVMRRRPPRPEVPSAGTVEAALAWVSGER